MLRAAVVSSGLFGLKLIPPKGIILSSHQQLPCRKLLAAKGKSDD